MAHHKSSLEAEETDAALMDKLKFEAQRALQERPSFSIRSRISLGYIIWFILSLGITIGSFIILTKIQNKLHFTESADRYLFEIQQARRFEKNYFLYRTNLGDAREHVHLAQNILRTNRNKMADVVGARSIDAMVRHIDLYAGLLDRLSKLKSSLPNTPSPLVETIEGELREHGATMITSAEKLINKERQSVNAMIYMSKRVPLFFLLVLLVLMVYLANFIARQMMQPLRTLMDATQRISEGDMTTPITPTRRYRDEFTELSLAMNHMMHQLTLHQEQLIKAHKLKAVGTLTAGVAHELNNPINNIMLTASMLQEDYPDLDETERLDMVNDLVEQAERSQRIIRNLLEFARERELTTHLYPVKDLIEETLQLVSNQLKLSKVKVARRLAPNLSPVSGDKQQLTQVFLNLILNAIDAMPGGGTLTIETTPADEKDYLKANFTDTGTGIPPHVQSHIFDPFFTTKSQGKGTGLGLSVSLEIVRKHGGDIRLCSQVDQGSTFSVLLPTTKIPANIPNGS